jgi:hypothetical protein
MLAKATLLTAEESGTSEGHLAMDDAETVRSFDAAPGHMQRRVSVPAHVIVGTRLAHLHG